MLETGVETFDQIGVEWDQLFSKQQHPHTFLSHAWHRVWWEHFSNAAILRLLTFRRNGALVGIAPFMLHNGRISHIGSTDLVDYHDVLMVDIESAELIDSLLLSLSRFDDWKVLDLESIPEWSQIVLKLPESAAAHGWSVKVTNEDVSPGIHLPNKWDEYLANIGRKQRHELRRKYRKLEAAGDINQVVYSTPQEITERLDDFFQLHRMSTAEKGRFMTPKREAFFRAMTAALAPLDMVRLYFLYLDMKPVATSLCFEHLKTRFVYNSGFNPEFYELSVGVINHSMVIRSSICEGIKFIDFLRGSERYKYDLGAHDRKLYRVLVTRQ